MVWQTLTYYHIIIIIITTSTRILRGVIDPLVGVVKSPELPLRT